MKRRSVIYILAVLLLLGGCSKRDYKLLSKKKMVAVMTEMYLTEGAFEAQYMRDQQEKLAYYNSLFNKYGITREDFEKSAAYYSEEPKNMEQIYEQVIENLKKVEEDVMNMKYHPTFAQEEEEAARRARLDSIDIWPKMQRRLVWNGDSVGDVEKFSFELRDTNFFAKADRFVLSFVQRVGKKDSLKAGVRMCVLYSDSTIDTVTAMVEKDSLLRRYRMSVNNVDSLRVMAVYGKLIDCDSVNAAVDRCFDSIKLARIYDAKSYPLNDSIRTQIKKMNTSSKDKKTGKPSSKNGVKNEIPVMETLPSRRALRIKQQ